jgi:hypothetical protein
MAMSEVTGMRHSRTFLRSFKPFFFYFPGGVALWVWTAMNAHYSWTSCVLFFMVGVVGWPLLEYGLHRGLHFPARSAWLREFLYQAHLVHHEDPQDPRLIFVRFSATAPISLLLFLLLWGLFGRWQEAALTLTGLWAGYLVYEFVHYSAHVGAPKAAWMRYLKKYHLLHHYQDDRSRYGVTTPVVDWVFRTHQPLPIQMSS